jgi:hypothetical protein
MSSGSDCSKTTAGGVGGDEAGGGEATRGLGAAAAGGIAANGWLGGDAGLSPAADGLARGGTGRAAGAVAGGVLASGGGEFLGAARDATGGAAAGAMPGGQRESTGADDVIVGCCGAAAGRCGTRTTALHLRHFAFLPAISAGALSVPWHWVHRNSIVTQIPREASARCHPGDQDSWPSAACQLARGKSRSNARRIFQPLDGLTQTSAAASWRSPVQARVLARM